MFSFAVLALAAASAGAHSISHVRRHHVPRTQPQQPPAGWATGYLEPYDTYHERYLEIGCENKHNTPFFDSCCHPLLSTETVAKNRPACCAVNATVACPGAAAPAKTSVAAPAKTSPAAAPAKTSVAAPAQSSPVAAPAKSSPAAAPAKSSPAAAPAKTSSATAPAKTTAAPAEGDDEDCDDDDGDDDNTGDDEDCDCDDEGDDGDDDGDDDDCEEEGDGSDEPPASPATTKKVASSTEATPSAAPSTTHTAAPKPTSTSTKAALKPTTTSTTAQHTTTSPASAPAPTGDKSTATYTTGGVGTWYMQDNEAGACGHWHSDSDFVVALQTKTYDHGINCGRGIQICDLDNNKCVNGIVADECPTCDNPESVDMSRGMFEALTALSVGQFKIKWTFTTS